VETLRRAYHGGKEKVEVDTGEKKANKFFNEVEIIRYENRKKLR
jgi:hypothetical protein